MEILNNNAQLNNKERNNSKFYYYLLAVVVFISVISQTSIFVERNIANTISIPVWVLAFVFGVFHKKGRIFVDKFLILGIVQVLLVLILSLFKISYLQTRVFRSFIIVLFIYFTTKLYSSSDNNFLILLIAKFFVFASLILAFDTYFNYLTRGSFVDESIYAYGSKNSTGMTLLSSVIFIYTIILPNAKGMKSKTIYVILSLPLLYVTIAVASRAVIACGVIVFISSLFLSKIPRKIKISILIILVVGILIILFNASLRDYFHKLITANRDVEDLSDLSSGRSEHWKFFFENFHSVIILGAGRYKFEAFLISVLYQYGIIVGTFFIAFSLYPIVIYNKTKKGESYNKNVYVCFILLIIAFLINGLFEELAPFGPGVKCMPLWIIAGLLSMASNKKKER